MSFPQNSADVLVVLSIFGVLFSALFFVIDARIRKTQAEFKPNGGSSVRDAIDRIERRQIEIASDVKDARAQFHSHIQWHLDKEQE